jgi:hypothetical protein
VHPFIEPNRGFVLNRSFEPNRFHEPNRFYEPNRFFKLNRFLNFELNLLFEPYRHHYTVSVNFALFSTRSKSITQRALLKERFGSERPHRQTGASFVGAPVCRCAGATSVFSVPFFVFGFVFRCPNW